MEQEKPKVYIERAENMTKDGAQAIINVCKEYSLSDEIINASEEKTVNAKIYGSIIPTKNVKEFIQKILDEFITRFYGSDSMTTEEYDDFMFFIKEKAGKKLK